MLYAVLHRSSKARQRLVPQNRLLVTVERTVIRHYVVSNVNHHKVCSLILALWAMAEHLFHVETSRRHFKRPHSLEIRPLFLDCNVWDLSLSQFTVCKLDVRPSHITSVLKTFHKLVSIPSAQWCINYSELGTADCDIDLPFRASHVNLRRFQRLHLGREGLNLPYSIFDQAISETVFQMIYSWTIQEDLHNDKEKNTVIV